MIKLIGNVFKQMTILLKCFFADYRFYTSPFIERGWYLFPPSFYIKHTKEECERLEKEEIEALRAIIAKMENEVQQN